MALVFSGEVCHIGISIQAAQKVEKPIVGTGSSPFKLYLGGT